MIREASGRVEDVNQCPKCYYCYFESTCPNCDYFKKRVLLKRRRKKKMNFTTAVMLINPNIKAVNVVYEAGGRVSTFKTLDTTLEVGDLVVVPTNTRHNFTVAKVVEINVDVDHDDPTEVSWIADKVDCDEFNRIVEQEKDMIRVMKQSEARKTTEILKSNVMEYCQEAEKESLLALSSVGGEVEKPAPAPAPINEEPI